MITILGGLLIFTILCFIALIELLIEILCIAIGIPVFSVIGIGMLISWLSEKIVDIYGILHND